MRKRQRGSATSDSRRASCQKRKKRGFEEENFLGKSCQLIRMMGRVGELKMFFAFKRFRFLVNLIQGGIHGVMGAEARLEKVEELVGGSKCWLNNASHQRCPEIRDFYKMEIYCFLKANIYLSIVKF